MKYTNGNETDSTTVIYRPMECMNCSDVQRENTQLKELNQKMVELIRFFEMDVDFMLGNKSYVPEDYLIDWSSRKIKIQKVLDKAEGKGR